MKLGKRVCEMSYVGSFILGTVLCVLFDITLSQQALYEITPFFVIHNGPVLKQHS